MKKRNIPRPSKAAVKSYLKKWDRLESYVPQEKSLNLLFQEAYPKNKKIEHVLIKVCCLNDFYSTNLYSSFMAAKHISKLNIDKDLAVGDEKLVDKISKMRIPNGRVIKFYSFASKYCSHHRPDCYPIYDSYVEKVLMHFRRYEGFHKFQRADLRDYPRFKEILGEFKKFFGLEEFSSKEIDKYLWQVGRDYFSKYQPRG